MADKESFKGFVQKNPRLITFVKNGDMTWQKFYEIYDLYGEDSSAWRDYLTSETTQEIASATTGFSVAEVLSWLKNINLDSLQEGVNNLQRVVGVIQDFGNKEETVETKEEYKPRPIYKHFED